jgi:hypothetical protein
MHWVTSVEYVSGYKLRLGFNDGSTRLADLADHLHGEIFEPLKNQRLFRTAKLNPDLDTVVWDNGADMAPDFLYQIGVPHKQPAARPAPTSSVGVADAPAKYPTKRNK